MRTKILQCVLPPLFTIYNSTIPICRGSKAYNAFTQALSNDDSYSWIVEELTNTDVTGIKTNSAAKSGPIKGIDCPMFAVPHAHVLFVTYDDFII